MTLYFNNFNASYSSIYISYCETVLYKTLISIMFANMNDFSCISMISLELDDIIKMMKREEKAKVRGNLRNVHMH